MGVLLWRRLVGNSGFLEGREQCLQSWLGSVVVSLLVVVDQQKYQTCLIFHRPFTTRCPDLGSAHLETRSVVGLYNMLGTLPVLSYTITVLSGSTCQPVAAQYLNTTSLQAVYTNQHCMKGDRHVVNITNLT